MTNPTPDALMTKIIDKLVLRISELRKENARLREQLKRLKDQYHTLARNRGIHIKEMDEQLRVAETARFLLEGAEKSALESERYWKDRTAVALMALRVVWKWCPGCGGREYVTEPTQQTRQFCPVCRPIREAIG